MSRNEFNKFLVEGYQCLSYSPTSQDSKPGDKVRNKPEHNEDDLLGDLPPLPTSKPPELPSRQENGWCISIQSYPEACSSGTVLSRLCFVK